MPIDTTSPAAETRRHDILKKRAVDPQRDDIVEEPHDCKRVRTANISPKIESHPPIGRVHAGEVSRRTDRQTSALPPPEPSTSSGQRPNATTGRGGRRTAAPGGGGFHSDSDSDDNDRKRASQGRDNPMTIRRPRRLAQPDEQLSSHYDEAKLSHQTPPLDEEWEIKKQRCMQETLKYLKMEMGESISIPDQVAEQDRLREKVPDDERVGPSWYSAAKLKYVDKLNNDMFNHELVAFTRRNGSTGADGDAMKPYFEKMLRSGHVKYKYVRLKAVPDCALELCKLLDSPFLERPSVFRVLVKDNMPIDAEPISESRLRELGWKLHETPPPTYWWRYERGTTFFSSSTIYRVRMTGQIDGIWKYADKDVDFSQYWRQYMRERGPLNS